MGDDIIKMRDDVQVLFLKLPNHIKEFVTMNPDMSYTIVLNVNPIARDTSRSLCSCTTTY